jgi:hypothetical protein
MRIVKREVELSLMWTDARQLMYILIMHATDMKYI